jgi:hypothetical protein
MDCGTSPDASLIGCGGATCQLADEYIDEDGQI